MAQILSPRAARAKAERDLRFAKTKKRADRKNHNQKEDRKHGTVGDGKDRHHTSSTTTVLASVKNNRGNFGKGTKNENV
tara:strand:- start:1607 stop:1843 length:237 start_codon:yes stop_codon:yes gene_type:complete